MGYTIVATTNGKRGDVYNVLSLPTLRAHVAEGHPTDSADLLLYFFLRDHSEEAPVGTPGTSYSLFLGKKKIIDSTVKGTSAVLALLSDIDSPKPKKKLKAVA